MKAIIYPEAKQVFPDNLGIQDYAVDVIRHDGRLMTVCRHVTKADAERVAAEYERI